MNWQTEQPVRVRAPPSRSQKHILPAPTPTTEANATKKKEAASRLLKSSIQHGLLKMQQLRKADINCTVPQAHDNAEEEFKKIEEEILQAVDDYLLIV